MAHRTRLKKSFLSWGIGICVLSGLGVWGYHFIPVPTQENTPMPLTVQTLQVVPQNLTLQRHYIGYVKPINSVEIHPFLAGFIDDIFIDDGAEVTEGQTLFLLKQDEYKAKLALEQANLLSAEAALVNAHQYYQRLLKTGNKAVAPAQMDEAKASFLSAVATVEAAKAAVQVAEVNYNYTTILAPISGRIGTIAVTLGDYVAPSSAALAYLIQEDPIRVMFSISDKEYAESLAQSALPFQDWQLFLQLADGERYAEPGVISYINNEMNTQTNALTVYADFPNPARLLVAQAYVDVILEKKLTNVLVLPLSVISWAEDKPFIFILNKAGIIEKIPLVLGPVQGEEVVVLNGLSPKQDIITTGVSSSEIGKKAVISPGQEVP